MISHAPQTVAAAVAAAVYFTAVGLPVARACGIAGFAPLSLAPALGWAVACVLALPVLSAVGFGAAQVTAFASVLLGMSLAALWRQSRPVTALPRWQIALAALPALLPMAAILPKSVPGGLRLAPPMFDHVKIAVVDAVLRDGLPVPNPFAGGTDPGHLAYYYLWHFGAAFVARLLHTGGWTAEAAMTGFTAFASLMLMLGAARALGGRTRAAVMTAVLCLPGSLRPLLVAALGSETAPALIPYNSDIGNWLNQAAWVPQHMQSASCVLISALLITRLGERAIFPALCLGLTTAAGFESSVWVGGVGFLVAGGALVLHQLVRTPARSRLLLHGLGAATLALALIAPFLRAELAAVAARHVGAGLSFLPYPVFGGAFSPFWRIVLDIPGFWLVLLPFLFPAVLPAALAFGWNGGTPWRGPFGVLAAGSLCVAWLLRSTFDNNDLGWRVVLPALLVATPMASVWLAQARGFAFLSAAVFGSLGLVQTAVFAGDYTLGQRPGDPAAFLRAQAMWADVRAATAPDERIANNPHDLEAVTPWAVNIGWALLSDRPSCYAGWETVLAYGAMSRAQLLAMNGRSRRVFAGVPVDGDLRNLRDLDHCAAVLVTSRDPAWRQPFWSDNAMFEPVISRSDWMLLRLRRR
jgi:hypothetical protein